MYFYYIIMYVSEISNENLKTILAILAYIATSTQYTCTCICTHIHVHTHTHTTKPELKNHPIDNTILPNVRC